MHHTHVPAEDGGAIPVAIIDAPGDAALLIIPAIFGLDPGVLEVARTVAAAGFSAWMFDPFWRSTPGVLSHSRLQEALARARAVPTAAVRADVRAVAAAMRMGPSPTAIATAGYCFGGPFALWAAAEGVADAAFAFHGSRLEGPMDVLPGLRCPVSLHFGEADHATPPSLIARLRTALAGNPSAQFHTYPGARHGFALSGHPGWDSAAAQASVQDLITGLGRLSS